MASWIVIAVAAALLLSLCWDTVIAESLPTGKDLVSWCVAFTLLLIGVGVARLKALARRLIVATAWLVSLYAAIFVLVALGLELRGLGLGVSPPEWAPARALWLGWWLLTVQHVLLLAAAVGVWWLLTRAAVRELFLRASRSAP